MSASDSPAVLTERRERVLVITINRPDQRNAVNAAVAQGIAAALDELDGDPELSASSPAPARASARAWTSRRSWPASPPRR